MKMMSYNYLSLFFLLLLISNKSWFLPGVVLSEQSSSSPPSPHLLFPPEVDLGTTLVAVKYENGVVVGADTRTSAGQYVSHRYAHKIVPITDHCVICRSGSAADTQQIAIAAQQMNDRRLHRYGITTTVSQLAHWLRRNMYSSSSGNNNDETRISLLVAGCDRTNIGEDGYYDEGNKPCSVRIFSIAPSGSLLEEKRFAASGSGSTYVMGFLDEQLKGDDDNIAIDEKRAIELCQRAIELAIQRDSSSGGLIRLHIIDNSSTRGRREWTVNPQATYSTRGSQRSLHLPGFAASTAAVEKQDEL